MTIYIDATFHCHTTNDGTMMPVETDAFDGCCRRFIEGYIFVPAGSTWTREDGRTYRGPIITPAEDFDTLMIAQRQYEEDQVQTADMQEALDILGVTE